MGTTWFAFARSSASTFLGFVADGTIERFPTYASSGPRMLICMSVLRTITGMLHQSRRISDRPGTPPAPAVLVGTASADPLPGRYTTEVLVQTRAADRPKLTGQFSAVGAAPRPGAPANR